MPTAADRAAGGKVVNVKVSDPRGGSDVRTFVIPFVAPAAENTQPYFTTIPDQSASSGNELRFRITAGDSDNDFLRWVPLQVPRGMVIHRDPREPYGSIASDLAWTPTRDQVGRHEVVIGVTDT